MPDPKQPPPPNARLAANWRRYLRFWGPRAEADVDDELRFHIEMRVREYVARGMSEVEARAATLRRLGDLATTRSECLTITTRRERRMTRAQLIDAFTQDVRFALRTLGRQKGWTTVAIITLALGIGANTAVFSVVNSLLLHPLPYPNADRIAIIFQEPNQGNNTGMQVMVTPRPEIVKAWRDGSRSFEDIEGYETSDVTLQPREGPTAVLRSASILPSFPRFTGQQPSLGRSFAPSDVVEGARVVVLSEPLWRGRFGADPRILGTTITLDGSPYTVIGVMPSAFRLPRVMQDYTDIWLPLDMRKKDVGLSVVGRLRPGASHVAAARELDSLTARVDADAKNRVEFKTKLVPPGEMVNFRDSLLMLTAAVALVLLIACANVAHLLLARTSTRQREMAIRAALGAGGARLFRQLLTESLVLAVAGCAGGIVVGWFGLRALIAMRPETLAELSSARMDLTTLLVATALAALTGVVFGVVGAIQSARHSTHEALKAGALSTSHARRHNRLRSLLVVSEMALSTTLLVGATLLVRSVIHLQTKDPGFEPANLYAIDLPLPQTTYSSNAARSSFFSQFATRARSVSGIRAVTIAEGAPPSRNFLIGALQIEGDAPPPVGTTGFLNYNSVEPVFFQIMGIRVVQGTTFTDTTEAAHQVVINEGMARKHWPGRSAVGKRLRVVYNKPGEWLTIVGVAADASTGGLTDQSSAPMLYMPPREHYRPAAIVRTAAGSDPIPTLRSLLANMDRHLPPASITSVDEAMSKSIAGLRFTMLLLTAFTMLAVILAAVGLYGVMAYAVAQRTREIGIRIALGATRRNIARAIVWQGGVLAVAGIIVGLVGAHWATKLLERMLYGVARGDPMSFAAGGLLLFSTALLACIVPMRRAVAVDPLIAMRAD